MVFLSEVVGSMCGKTVEERQKAQVGNAEGRLERMLITMSPRALLFVVLSCLACIGGAQDGPPQKIKDSLKRADAEIEKIIAVPDKKRTFENTLGALDDLSVRLDNETAVFTFLQFVST